MERSKIMYFSSRTSTEDPWQCIYPLLLNFVNKGYDYFEKQYKNTVIQQVASI